MGAFHRICQIYSRHCAPVDAVAPAVLSAHGAGAGRVVGVQRGENPVPRQRSAEGHLGGFSVVDLTHHDHIRILAQQRPMCQRAKGSSPRTAASSRARHAARRDEEDAYASTCSIEHELLIEPVPFEDSHELGRPRVVRAYDFHGQDISLLV